MAAKTHRAFPRTQYEAPIKYLNVDPNYVYMTRMHSFSKGGLYFESFQCLTPDLQIYIIMTNYSPNSEGPEAYQSYLAKIRWCHKLPQVDKPRYGVGVEFLEKSHALLGVEGIERRSACDMCEAEAQPELVCRMDDHICLCLACFNQLEVLVPGIVKRSVIRFLNGNVI